MVSLLSAHIAQYLRDLAYCPGRTRWYILRMTELDRRNALKAAAWAAPVVALAASAPLAAASGPTVTITGIRYTGYFDYYELSVDFTNIPSGVTTMARLTITPSGPALITAQSAPVRTNDSTDYFTAYGFTPGLQYTFTINLTGGSTGQAVFQHTF